MLSLVVILVVEDSAGLDMEGALVGLTALLGGLMLLASWLLGPVRYRAPVTTLGLRLPDTRNLVGWTAATLAGIVAFNFLFVWIVQWAGWEGLLPPPLPPGLGLEWPQVLVTALLVALWSPFAEEVFFRGFTFGGLEGSWGFPGAGVVSSALFALAHGTLGVMIPAFVSGMLLAWLYFKSRSIWPCIFVHAAQNGLALAAASGS